MDKSEKPEPIQTRQPPVKNEREEALTKRITTEVVEAFKEDKFPSKNSHYHHLKIYQRQACANSLAEFRLVKNGELTPADLALDVALQTKGLHDLMSGIYLNKIQTTGLSLMEMPALATIAKLAQATHLGIANYSHQKRLEEGASDKPKTAEIGVMPKRIKAKQTTETKEITAEYGEVIEQTQTIEEKEIELVPRK